MLTLSILENMDTSILFEIPAGKPDPNQAWLIEKDTRNRVFQSAYKGNNCWYYTFNFIRKRIGKNPPQELLQQRELEKICSARRKAQTNHENSLPSSANQLHTELGFKALTPIDLSAAQRIVANKAIMQPYFETPELKEDQPSLFPFIEEFANKKTHANMHAFLVAKKFETRIKINSEFLSHLNSDLKEASALDGLEQTEIGKVNGQDHSITSKAAILDALVREASAKIYGLQKSTWTPSKGIEGLIEELKKKGPLAIGGAFGKGVYLENPFKMNQKIKEREIYAWKRGAKRHKMTFSGHVVLLIGAKKVQDQAFVYFIDPGDPSDPKDLSQQKIYMISFKNLTSHICDLFGCMNPNSSSSYAYYGTFKTELLEDA